jgi:hypothetical protein
MVHPLEAVVSGTWNQGLIETGLTVIVESLVTVVFGQQIRSKWWKLAAGVDFESHGFGPTRNLADLQEGAKKFHCTFSSCLGHIFQTARSANVLIRRTAVPSTRMASVISDETASRGRLKEALPGSRTQPNGYA